MKIIVENKDIVSELRIEGHTDRKWRDASSELDAYYRNTDLSQKRALLIMEYLFRFAEENKSDSPEYANWMKFHVTAHGLSSSRSGEKKKDRRIDLRVQAKAIDNGN